LFPPKSRSTRRAQGDEYRIAPNAVNVALYLSTCFELSANCQSLLVGRDSLSSRQNFWGDRWKARYRQQGAFDQNRASHQAPALFDRQLDNSGPAGLFFGSTESRPTSKESADPLLSEEGYRDRMNFTPGDGVDTSLCAIQLSPDCQGSSAVEQGTHKPLVGSSILPPGIF
jgi:hypothetical protein